METFPNCQFILTTHSPQILSHVRCQDIWCLVQVEQNIDIIKPDGTYGQDSNFLLKTLMGSVYRPKHIERKLSLLFDTIRKNTLEARKLLNELKTEVEGESPDILLLHRREVMNK